MTNRRGEGLAAIQAVVEDVRARSFPDVPAGLVSQIVQTEWDHLEDRTTGAREVARHVLRALDEGEDAPL